MTQHTEAVFCLLAWLAIALGAVMQIVGWGLFIDFPKCRDRPRQLKEWSGLYIAISGIGVMCVSFAVAIHLHI